VPHETKVDRIGIGIEGILAETCYCMGHAERQHFEYSNLESYMCRENCEGREIREGHDVKSLKGFEGVVLVRDPWLNVKSLQIE
jgi:hypothetical protein